MLANNTTWVVNDYKIVSMESSSLYSTRSLSQNNRGHRHTINKQTYPQIPTVPPRRSLSGHGLILLGGAVGISVARNPADGHLRCLGAGALVVERLSKQQSKRGVKFVSLLRTGAIPIRHCKNVTCEWVVVASDEDHPPPSTVALWISWGGLSCVPGVFREPVAKGRRIGSTCERVQCVLFRDSRLHAGSSCKARNG